MAPHQVFEIHENDLPVVRTRQALLVIDLQNDVVSQGSVLSVDRPIQFVETIVDLATAFRELGSVVWVKSQFETNRSINGGRADDENVITDAELSPLMISRAGQASTSKKPSKKLLEIYERIRNSAGGDEDDEDDPADETEECYDDEAFLTVGTGREPHMLLPMSAGCNFTQAIKIAIDSSKDLVFEKSHYSAFKSGRLLQILRGQFVTELFICGALTNISIYATAMDAARYGFSITIIEDCLGYRSHARHREALRLLLEATGCDTISSDDMKKEIRHQLNARNRNSRNSRRPADRRRPLQELMGSLVLKDETETTSLTKSHPTESEVSTTNAIEDESKKIVSKKESESTTSVSDEPLHQSGSTEKKPEVGGKTRVKNKVKCRRPSSKSVVAENDELALNASPSLTEPKLSGTSLEKIPSTQTATVPAQTTETTTESHPPLETQDINTNPLNPVTPHSNSQTSHTSSGTTKDGKLDMAEPIPAMAPNNNTSICEGDTFVINNLLSEAEASGIFERLRDEVRWEKMSHQGGEVPRLVAVQGDIGADGSIPIYRHPADESPPLLKFSPAVSIIRKAVEKELGHSVNHCLIQFYRSGTDYISEHSDKTLDIVPDTFIANVSLGAMRTMTFRTKRPPRGTNLEEVDQKEPRQSCRAPLPHNSMCKVGLVTNMRWLHSIRQDKRTISEKTEAELAFGGARISLTFRLIGTFLNKEQTKIWGQGAVAKDKDHAKTVINGETQDAQKLLRAFGTENQSSEFDWAATYGEGFDVLHISNNTKLFLSGDKVANLRVKLMLAEYGIPWSEGKLSPLVEFGKGSSNTGTPVITEQASIKFVDNDLARSLVRGDVAILLYLFTVKKNPADVADSRPHHARQFTLLHEAESLRHQWQADPCYGESLQESLVVWDAYATENTFIAGTVISLADFAFWPILHEVVETLGNEVVPSQLKAYYDRVLERKCVKQVLDISDI